MNSRRLTSSQENVNDSYIPTYDEVEMWCDEVNSGQTSSLSSLLKTIGKDPMIYNIILKKNLLPKVVQLLQTETQPQLQIVLYFVINYISGDKRHTKEMFDVGLLNSLNHLLKMDVQTVESALWIMANLAGDGGEFKQAIINLDIYNLSINLLRRYDSAVTRKHISWLFCNICRGGDIEKVELILPFANYQFCCIDSSQPVEVISDSLWTFAFLSEFDKYDNIYVNDTIQRFLSFVSHPETKVSVPALRFFGNLTTRNDVFVQKLLQFPLLKEIQTVLQTTNYTSCCREIFWIVSNVLSSTFSEVVYDVINNYQFLRKAINGVISQETHPEILSEMCWCISNKLSQCLPRIIVLHMSNYRLLNITLKSIINTLKFGVDSGVDIANIYESLDVTDILKQAAMKTDNSLAKKRIQIALEYITPEDIL
ncbi:Importin alpha-1 subunit [Entamoeba marina]